MGKPEPRMAAPGLGNGAVSHARHSVVLEQSSRSLERPDSIGIGSTRQLREALRKTLDIGFWQIRVNWRGSP